MKNPYSVLDVLPDAGIAEIRDSYRRLVQHNLADKTKFDELQNAYEILTNPELKAKYDMETASIAADTTMSVDRTIVFESTVGGKITCPFAGGTVCPSGSGKPTSGEEFCSECGVQYASIVDRSFELEPVQSAIACFEQETGRQHALIQGRNTVGRESADVLVVDKTVSRLHAQFHMTGDDAVSLEDLGSTNGTHVNGERLEPNQPKLLSDGDTVRFGSVRGTFKAKPHTTTGLETGQNAVPVDRAKQLWSADNSDREQSGAPMSLVVRSQNGMEFPLTPPGPVSVGRRPDNTVPITGDPFVSGRHLQFIYDEPTWQILDLGSTNGTYFNENRIPPHEQVELNVGDTISVGSETFTIHQDETNLAYANDPSENVIALDGGAMPPKPLAESLESTEG